MFGCMDFPVLPAHATPAQPGCPPPPTRLPAAGALKSGFTRTGKRTLGGLVDDGVKSIGRYYLNNFQVGCHEGALP